MLLIHRKVDDEIVIDERIIITVTRVGSGSVTLGIEAPLEVPIRRHEQPAVQRRLALEPDATSEQS